MDSFEYVQGLGEGAYGHVWLCRVRNTGQHVAMKRFKEAHTDAEVMRLAMREIKLLKASQHPNVVQLIEAFRSKSGRVYIVMEYVERTLTQDLRKFNKGFPPVLAKMVAWQLLQALSFLHKKKMMHRDLKPANILLSSENMVKICDFGFARTMQREPADFTTYVVTRWYRPPEVLVNDEYGSKVDVWAVGCLLCEMASGRPMFPGKTSADQLWLTMLTLGPLPGRQVQLMHEDPTYDAVRVPTAVQRTPLHQRFPSMPPALMDVVVGCLALSPAARFTADEAMEMPYFEDVPAIQAAAAAASAKGQDYWAAVEAEWQAQNTGGACAPSKGSHSKPASRQSSRSNLGAGGGGAAAAVAQGRLTAAVLCQQQQEEQEKLGVLGAAQQQQQQQQQLGIAAMGMASMEVQRQGSASADAQRQGSQSGGGTALGGSGSTSGLLGMGVERHSLPPLPEQEQVLQQQHDQQGQRHFLHHQQREREREHALSGPLPLPQYVLEQHSKSAAPKRHHSTSSNVVGGSAASNVVAPSTCDATLAGTSTRCVSLHHLQGPSPTHSASSQATRYSAPLTPLPIQQMRRIMSKAHVSGLNSTALCPRTSSGQYDSAQLPEMGYLGNPAHLRHLQRATSGHSASGGSPSMVLGHGMSSMSGRLSEVEALGGPFMLNSGAGSPGGSLRCNSSMTGPGSFIGPQSTEGGYSSTGSPTPLAQEPQRSRQSGGLFAEAARAGSSQQAAALLALAASDRTAQSGRRSASQTAGPPSSSRLSMQQPSPLPPPFQWGADNSGHAAAAARAPAGMLVGGGGGSGRGAALRGSVDRARSSDSSSGSGRARTTSPSSLLAPSQPYPRPPGRAATSITSLGQQHGHAPQGGGAARASSASMAMLPEYASGSPPAGARAPSPLGLSQAGSAAALGAPAPRLEAAQPPQGPTSMVTTDAGAEEMAAMPMSPRPAPGPALLLSAQDTGRALPPPQPPHHIQAQQVPPHMGRSSSGHNNTGGGSSLGGKGSNSFFKRVKARLMSFVPATGAAAGGEGEGQVAAATGAATAAAAAAGAGAAGEKEED